MALVVALVVMASVMRRCQVVAVLMPVVSRRSHLVVSMVSWKLLVALLTPMMRRKLLVTLLTAMVWKILVEAMARAVIRRIPSLIAVMALMRRSFSMVCRHLVLSLMPTILRLMEPVLRVRVFSNLLQNSLRSVHRVVILHCTMYIHS